jgi:uncharacterized SAM-binding protein YcdF (DUF218 family)
MIYAHKILPLIVSPLGVVLLLLLLALLFRKRWPIFVSLVVLISCSMPWVSDRIWALVEGHEAKLSVASLSDADAVVVLSGMLHLPRATEGDDFEWGDPDRFFGGLAVLNAGKAPVLVFTGGRLPWERSGANEGQKLRATALGFGVRPEQILVTEDVENTEQEAGAVRKLLSSQSTIILVTSAFHMPRAAKLFINQGFIVHPYAVDFKIEDHKITALSFIPHARAFWRSSEAVRELIGRFYYMIKYL